jgi:hypothetical protein
MAGKARTSRTAHVRTPSIWYAVKGKGMKGIAMRQGSAAAWERGARRHAACQSTTYLLRWHGWLLVASLSDIHLGRKYSCAPKTCQVEASHNAQGQKHRAATRNEANLPTRCCSAQTQVRPTGPATVNPLTENELQSEAASLCLARTCAPKAYLVASQHRGQPPRPAVNPHHTCQTPLSCRM